MNLSKHLKLTDAIASNTAKQLGIKNEPSSAILENIKLTGKYLYDPLYEEFGTNLTINSFFRSSALNKAVKGSPTSDHIQGRSIDLKLKTGSSLILADWIKDNLKFDQLIYEYPKKNDLGWVHVSYRESNRSQILIAHKQGNKVVYSPYNTELIKILTR